MAAVAGPARAFFFGLSIWVISFSLSPPEISSLQQMGLARGIIEEVASEANLILFAVPMGGIADAFPPAPLCKGGRPTKRSFSGTGGGLKTFRDGAVVFCCSSTERFASSSPIFAFRRAKGIRLTRISIRVRRFCDIRLYCARSFRARSVTVIWVSSASTTRPAQRTHSLIGDYRSKLASEPA